MIEEDAPEDEEADEDKGVRRKRKRNRPDNNRRRDEYLAKTVNELAKKWNVDDDEVLAQVEAD